MALKLKGTGSEKSAKSIGVSYQQHLTAGTGTTTNYLTTQPVTGMVSTSKSVSGEEIAASVSETQMLHPGVFSDGMSIRVEGGRVMNLGNYETARVGVTITVPCNKESLEEAYAYATEWVSNKINEAVAMAKE